MFQYKTIDSRQFIDLIRTPLEKHDTDALARLIQEKWSHEQVIQLLGSHESDVRKLAALALGLVGDRRSITALANCLCDSDPMVNQMAEHALWSVWFRSGSKQAQERVHHGAELLNNKQFDDALVEFTAAIRIDPTYAEARNQRAITYYLVEDFHASIDDGQLVVQLMPSHFGAWSGLGHCFAHIADNRRALNAYRRALAINPYLIGIRDIMKEIHSGFCKTDRDHH